MNPRDLTPLWPIEQLINRGVGLSSTAGALALALGGQTLDINFDGTPLALRLTAQDGQVRVTASAADDSPPDAALAGTPLAMLRLLGGDPEALIRDGDIRLTGNDEVANRFRDLLHHARPDLEEELSRVLGDPLAHQLGNFAREFAAWSQRTAASLARSTGEFLTEEQRALPTRVEVDEFCAAVDRISNDVERAAARLARLRDRIS